MGGDFWWRLVCWGCLKIRGKKVDSSLLQGTHLLISIVTWSCLIRFYGYQIFGHWLFGDAKILQDAWLLHPFQPKARCFFFHARTRRSCHASDPFRLDIWKAKELYLQLPEWVRPGSVATCPHKKRFRFKRLKILNHRRAKNMGETRRNHEKPVKNHETSRFFLDRVTFLACQLRRIGGQRASIACCLCRSGMFVPGRVRRFSLGQLWSKDDAVSETPQLPAELPQQSLIMEPENDGFPREYPFQGTDFHVSF